MQNEILKKYTDLIKRIKLLRKSIIDVTAVTLTQIRDGKQLEPTILNRGWLEDLQTYERTLLEMESDGSRTSDEKDFEFGLIDLNIKALSGLISQLRAKPTTEPYFAIPSNKFMIYILHLFAGSSRKTHKTLLLDNSHSKQAQDIIHKTINVKNIEYTDENFNPMHRTEIVAIIQDTPKFFATAKVPQELFEDIEGKESRLAYDLRHTFGAVGIKHFLGFLLQLDNFGREGRFMWNVNKHLDLLGYKKQGNGDHKLENKDVAYKILKLLGNLLFTVERKDERGNGRIQARKLFNISGYDTTIHNNRPLGDTNIEVAAEPFWYGRNFQILKDDGTKQSPQFTKLIKKIVRESTQEHSITLFLAPLLAILWRQDTALNRTLENLIDLLGLRLEGDETNRKRIIKNIESELEYMVKQGYLGGYKIAGQLTYKNLKTTIQLEPPKELREQLETIQHKREAYTAQAVKNNLAGALTIISREEFVKIMEKSGLSQLQFASQLGISSSMISKIKKGEREISKEINAAIWELKSKI